MLDDHRGVQGTPRALSTVLNFADSICTICQQPAKERDLMDCLICPFDGAHGFHLLVMVIDNDYVITQGFLKCLHPVCMNDTWWHLVSCCGIVDKTELNDL